jgi:hypothetical protein
MKPDITKGHVFVTPINNVIRNTWNNSFNTSTLFALGRKQKRGSWRCFCLYGNLTSCAPPSSSFISFFCSCARWSVENYEGRFWHIISDKSLTLLHIRTTVCEMKYFLFHKRHVHTHLHFHICPRQRTTAHWHMRRSFERIKIGIFEVQKSAGHLWVSSLEWRIAKGCYPYIRICKGHFICVQSDTALPKLVFKFVGSNIPARYGKLYHAVPPWFRGSVFNTDASDEQAAAHCWDSLKFRSVSTSCVHLTSLNPVTSWNINRSWGRNDSPKCKDQIWIETLQAAAIIQFIE